MGVWAFVPKIKKDRHCLSHACLLSSSIGPIFGHVFCVSEHRPAAAAGGGAARGIRGWQPRRSNIPSIKSKFQNTVGPHKGRLTSRTWNSPRRRGVPVAPLPRDYQPMPGVGGNAESYFFFRHYVDDGILAESQRLQRWLDDRRCRRAEQ